MKDKNVSSTLGGIGGKQLSAEVLRKLGHAMATGQQDGSMGLPAGYVYLGQFLAHDMTQLVVEAAGANNTHGHRKPRVGLSQLRTPSLDLDSVYGQGFDDPLCYVDKDNGEMILGLTSLAEVPSANDLPRNSSDKIALIPDTRNDENFIVAQLHLVFLKLHNLFVDQAAPELTPKQKFELAQKRVIETYHEIIVHDFLKRILNQDIYQTVVKEGNTVLFDQAATKTNDKTFAVPLEFSLAAFRFGHSMVRPNYPINFDTPAKNISELFELTGEGGFGGADSLPESCVIDWSLFFKTDEATKPTNAKQIDPFISFKLPPTEDDDNIAVLNLLRGRELNLSSAQDLVATLNDKHDFLDLPLLNAAQLDVNGVLSHQGIDAEVAACTPLWYYILAEASVLEQGRRLGPLGSLISAVTIMGILKKSASSVAAPGWSRTPDIFDLPSGPLTMADLIKTLTQPKNSQTEGKPMTKPEAFYGQFQPKQRTDNNPSHSDKASYYPGANLGIVIEFSRHEHSSQGAIPMSLEAMKGKVIAHAEDWDGAEAFERATFFYKEGRFFSTPMRTNIPLGNPSTGNQYLTEILEMQDDGTMLHTVFWEDGDVGTWLCPFGG